MDGRFEGDSIVVDIEIVSPVLNRIRHTFPVIIDTGFTSDLCITYKEAFPLALTLVGFQDYSIADGSKVTFFECLGFVKYGDKSVLSTISIRPSGSLLMGVSLMKKLGLTLTADFANQHVKITNAEPTEAASSERPELVGSGNKVPPTPKTKPS